MSLADAIYGTSARSSTRPCAARACPLAIVGSFRTREAGTLDLCHDHKRVLADAGELLSDSNHFDVPLAVVSRPPPLTPQQAKAVGQVRPRTGRNVWKSTTVPPAADVDDVAAVCSKTEPTEPVAESSPVEELPVNSSVSEELPVPTKLMKVACAWCQKAARASGGQGMRRLLCNTCQRRYYAIRHGVGGMFALPTPKEATREDWDRMTALWGDRESRLANPRRSHSRPAPVKVTFPVALSADVTVDEGSASSALSADPDQPAALNAEPTLIPEDSPCPMPAMTPADSACPTPTIPEPSGTVAPSKVPSELDTSTCPLGKSSGSTTTDPRPLSSPAIPSSESNMPSEPEVSDVAGVATSAAPTATGPRCVWQPCEAKTKGRFCDSHWYRVKKLVHIGLIKTPADGRSYVGLDAAWEKYLDANPRAARISRARGGAVNQARSVSVEVTDGLNATPAGEVPTLPPPAIPYPHAEMADLAAACVALDEAGVAAGGSVLAGVRELIRDRHRLRGSLDSICEHVLDSNRVPNAELKDDSDPWDQAEDLVVSLLEWSTKLPSVFGPSDRVGELTREIERADAVLDHAGTPQASGLASRVALLWGTKCDDEAQRKLDAALLDIKQQQDEIAKFVLELEMCMLELESERRSKAEWAAELDKERAATQALRVEIAAVLDAVRGAGLGVRSGVSLLDTVRSLLRLLESLPERPVPPPSHDPSPQAAIIRRTIALGRGQLHEPLEDDVLIAVFDLLELTVFGEPSHA